MNKKGFASSTIIYGLLSIFLIAISILIYTMNSNVSLNKSLNEKTIENIEYGSSSLNELEVRIVTLEKNNEELQRKINLLENKSILEETYPVGSIYISVSSTNPGNIFGGEWVSYSQGRTLVGINMSDSDFSTVEKTGGEKTHTLTISEMPSHTHNDGTSGTNAFSITAGTSSAQVTFDATLGRPTTATGGSKAHNNLQPYITVYMWKRTK